MRDIVKKTLLTAAVAALAFSPSTYASEDMFYVRANVGYDKLLKVNSLKSDNGVFLGLGAGYYVMDNVRADLAYDHYFDAEYKGKVAGLQAKLKSKADSLLLNGFVDLFDVSVAKVFAGAGIGMSMINGTLTYDNAAAPNKKLKKKNNFAFAGYLGTSAEVAPGINLELTYSYRDLGKLKKGSGVSGNIKGHHVTGGVRFDI